MKRFFMLTAIAAIFICQAASAGSPSKFPKIDQKGRIAIVAHRGFWKCEAAGFSENSIASLREAQKAGLWGSECDIHLTKDDVVIVNHNRDIEGAKIAEHTFAELSQYKLPNGERRPTFDEYLVQAKKSSRTILVVEFKKQPSKEREDLLVEKSVELLKARGLFKPSRVLFISFSQHICEIIAEKYPKFINQFLTDDKVGDQNPAIYAAKSINGVDYKYRLFQAHPEWVKIARDNGMSVNSWTVNKEKDINDMINAGVDAITTNEPLLVRQLLGEREFRK